jgi:hypothetical protein
MLKNLAAFVRKLWDDHNKRSEDFYRCRAAEHFDIPYSRVTKEQIKTVKDIIIMYTLHP